MTRSVLQSNTIASLGTSLLTPVFNRGRIRAGVDQAIAAYRESLAEYQKTVLTALANQRVSTDISGQQMVATVTLIKALGGGWLQ